MESIFKNKATGFALDPRTKLLLIIMVNILLFTFGNQLYVYAAVLLGGLLVIASGPYKVAINAFIVFGVFTAISRMVLHTNDLVQNIWGLIGLPVLVFFPFFLYAFLLFTTTSISEAAAALRKMKIPTSVITPFLVMFRFFPTIRREFINISNAMKLRGAVGKGNPLKMVEYVYIPLLFSIVKTGEELTLSAMTRGLGIHKTATSISEPKIRFIDIICVFVLLVLILARGGILL